LATWNKRLATAFKQSQSKFFNISKTRQQLETISCQLPSNNSKKEYKDDQRKRRKLQLEKCAQTVFMQTTFSENDFVMEQ
jgi:hypothetical protein